MFRDTWAGVPGILCFPTYFLYVISTVINHYVVLKAGFLDKESQSSLKILILGWFHMLSPLLTILMRAVGSDLKIALLCPSDIEETLQDAVERYLSANTNTITLPWEMLSLEYYMVNEDDKIAYRNILKTVNLKMNGVDRLCDLVKCLKYPPVETDNLEVSPPDSLHYTRFTTGIPPPDRHGPEEWGPYYWKIFHTVADHPPPPDDDKNPEYAYVYDGFPSVLPSTIPCLDCQINYFIHVQPSTIPTSLSYGTELYSRIHDRVSDHVHNMQKRINHRNDA